MSLFLIAQLCLCHGEQDIVEGCTPIAERDSTVEGGVRGLVVGYAIVTSRRGIPVNVTRGIPFDGFEGQRKLRDRGLLRLDRSYSPAARLDRWHSHTIADETLGCLVGRWSIWSG